MPHRLIRPALWALAAVAIGAGAYVGFTRSGAPQAVAAAPSPHREPPSSDLPSYARQDPAIAALYRWAATHGRELRYIPCACGCEELQHTSAWNCFVKAELRPGYYAWDDHGVECGVCQSIALQVKKGLAAHKSLRRIRQEVDQRWGPIEMKTPYPPDEVSSTATKRPVSARERAMARPSNARSSVAGASESARLKKRAGPPVPQ
jgi:hypothetical protein